MKKRFVQEAAQKQLLLALKPKTHHASLSQKTKLVEARDKNNELIDQIFESVFTIAISYIMSAVGFKTAALYVNSSPRAASWIAAERDAEALPWMQNLIRMHPVLKQNSRYHNPINLFHDFQKVIAEWEREIAGLSPAEMTRIYGENKELLVNGIGLDLSKILGSKADLLLQKYYNYGEYAIKQGSFNFELKFAYLLALSVPFFRHLIIEPAIKPVFHKLYNLRFLLETPINELSQVKADELLVKSEKEKLLLNKLSKAGLWLNYLITLGALVMALYAHEDGKWPSPELMIYISATIIKAAITKLQHLHQLQQRITVAKKLELTIKTYTDMFSFLHCDVEVHRGKKIRDTYITLKANEFERLSPALVNQIVKNTLLKNHIDIFEYTKTTHSFRLQELSKSQINVIRSQINQALSIRITIKMHGTTTKANQKLSLSTSVAGSLIIKPLPNKLEEIETDQSAKEYFRSLKQNHDILERKLNLKNLFEDVEKQLKSLAKEERFTKIRKHILDITIKPLFVNATENEISLLQSIRKNPSKVTIHDKKAHMHIVKNFNTVEKYLSEMQAACQNYQNMLKAKLPRPVKLSRDFNPAVVTNFSSALFSSLANEKRVYEQKSSNFAYNLLVFCDYEMDDTALAKNIQIHALLFTIIEFMRFRVEANEQFRKDPSENFSEHILTGLTHSKNLILENSNLEDLTILHAEVIEFCRTIIDAMTLNNYELLNTNDLCIRILKHARELEASPEIISDDDSITYSLITGTLIQTFQTFESILPDGMLLAAFKMVNLKAKTYDGYEQPLSYLEYLAQPQPAKNMWAMKP